MERETLELIIGSFALLSFCYMGLALSLLASRRRKQKIFDKSKLKYTDGDNT
jgi:hypothetical protein